MGNEITFEIKKHYGDIAESSSGWKKELNLVSWNEREPKLDIREWNPEHDHMSRGITLNAVEAGNLYNLLTEAMLDSSWQGEE